MNDKINHSFPETYTAINKATEASGFSMASDILTCSLLRTLAASKPAASFLELGTGTGLSTAWILDGMDSNSTLVSIDNDSTFLKIAAEHLENDKRLELVMTGGATWISENISKRFDYIFADTWPGKYLLLEEVLSMLQTGGLYIIDDMLPQPNWPDGHEEKANKLVKLLESRTDMLLTKLNWASGIIIATKIK